MGLDTTELLICFTTLLAALYYYLTSNFDFWTSRNVKGPKPIPIFGTVKDIMFNKYSIGSYLKSIYDQYPNEPMIGIYTHHEPVLVLNDMEMIKTILIKDFKSFVDRGMGMHEKYEPLTAHLFNLEPKRWRPLRTKLSPVFTSGKLREMFYLLIECANQLDTYLEKVDGKSVDIREISAKFMTDTIGVCAFGLQANALADEDSTFRKMGKRIFENSLKNAFKFRLRNFAPRIFDIIGGYLVDNELTQFFLDLTRDTVEFRKKNGVNRHDFIDLLMALQNEPSKVDDIELTNSLMAAELFVFFIAGFETSSSTSSNCLFELAQNHGIRDKLRKEIHEELSKTEGVVTYEGIKNMQYLDKVVNETLRKYPPVPVLMRKSTSPYTFPGTKVSIPVDTKVWIPIFATQRDPKYYPNPDVFDPERFSDEAMKTRPHMTFLSFGEGPRNCIGARFGRMQTKVALVKILQNYTVDVSDKTDKNYEINQKMFLLTPKNGIYLTIKRQEMQY
nr:cytochrome P450 4AV17 [Meteorus pulchricornis]